MHKELKKAILEWLLENERRVSRVNGCCEEFESYIYNSNGNYLIGGKDVYRFIQRSGQVDIRKIKPDFERNGINNADYGRDKTRNHY